MKKHIVVSTCFAACGVVLAVVLPLAAVEKKPLVFCQTQLYSQGDPSCGYLNRYVDFPLFLDNDRFPAVNPDRIGPRRISRADFDAQLEQAVEYGIDGFAYFPSWMGAANVLAAAAASKVERCRMVPIIGFWHNPENDEAALPEAMANPRGCQIDGKQLILSYWTAKYHTPERLKARLDAMREKFGDRFLFPADLPKAGSSAYQETFRLTGSLTAAQVREYQDHVRSYLRVCDGVYLGETHMMNRPEAGERVFDTAYYRTMLALTRAVLNEPEFAGRKLLGASAIVGHENAYSRGHNTSHNGTRTLRDSMEAAIAAKSDFIMLPEWDEWNENTCFAPTLYNSFAVKRIMRVYMAELGKIASSDVPGDDRSVPNLIVSYRRLLSPGEPLCVEVLNLPDRGGGEMSVAVTLVDEQGRVLKDFPTQTCSAARMAELRFTAASEELAPLARTIGVAVRCRSADGRESAFDEGLSPIDLACGNGWLHKNVKQPLRDLAKMTRKEVAYANGRLRANLVCDRPIRYAMAVDNGDVVKVIGRPGHEEPFSEDETHAVFSLSDVAYRGKTDAKAGFRFEVHGGEDVSWFRLPDTVRTGKVFKTEWISRGTEPIFLRLAKRSLEAAKLEIDFPGIAHESVSLKTAFERGLTAVGKGCATFGVRRFRGQSRFPSPLGRNECVFDVAVVGNRKSNAFYVEVVTMDGKTWRSPAFVDEPKEEGTECLRVWSAVTGRPGTIMMSKARVPSLEYDFSDASGDAILPKSGELRFAGVMGGYIGAVVGYNRGDSTLSAMDGFERWKATVEDFRPRREGEALVFDGVDDVVGFPSDTLPFQSGWTVAFEFRPDDAARTQMLLSDRTRHTGNLWGVSLVGGKVKVGYVSIDVSSKGGYTFAVFPQAVRAGEWNRLVLRYEVDALELTLNGVTERRPCVAPGQLPAPLILGGLPAEVPDGGFFKGGIRRFRIDCRAGTGEIQLPPK